jgi:teichuronic acid biosynthesis glycosyltransferase TuaC
VNLKVLLVSNNFPNSAEPVRGVFTYHIAKSLQEKCNLEVIAPLPWLPKFVVKRLRPKYPFAHVPAEEYINGIKVYHPRYLVIPRVLGFMHAVFMFVPLFRLIKRLEDERKVDLINAHWIFPDGVATAWVGKMLNIPTVLTGLGCDLNYYPSLPFRKGPIKEALNKAHMITVKGKKLERPVVELGISEKKISVIPNGLNLGQFRILSRDEARKSLQIEYEVPIILTVSSQDDAKGGRYLIEAMGLIGDLQPENIPMLLMVGDGPLKGALIAQARELEIEKSILFLGKRPHDEIHLWMNAADLFCLPSIREGRPNVLLEALACGTPVVASNVGSVPEIVRQENGRLVRPADPGNLCREICACLNCSWDRNLIRRTVGMFSWDDCAELYKEVYLKVLRHSPEN